MWYGIAKIGWFQFKLENNSKSLMNSVWKLSLSPKRWVSLLRSGLSSSIGSTLACWARGCGFDFCPRTLAMHCLHVPASARNAKPWVVFVETFATIKKHSVGQIYLRHSWQPKLVCDGKPTHWMNLSLVGWWVPGQGEWGGWSSYDLVAHLLISTHVYRPCCQWHIWLVVSTVNVGEAIWVINNHGWALWRQLGKLHVCLLESGAVTSDLLYSEICFLNLVFVTHALPTSKFFQVQYNKFNTSPATGRAFLVATDQSWTHNRLN